MQSQSSKLRRAVFIVLAGILPLACSLPRARISTEQFRWFPCAAQAPKSILPELENVDHGLHFVAAHRGDTSRAPGNSLSAIYSAIEQQIPLIEIDVRLSPDGTLFLYHDRKISSEVVHAPTALIGKDIDTVRDTERETLRLRGEGFEPVAELRDALRLIRESRSSALLIDMKTSLANQEKLIERIVEIVEREAARDGVIIQCQGLKELSYVRKHYPQLAVLARISAPGEIEAALAERPLIVQGDFDWLTEQASAKVHRSGARVLLKRLSAGTDTPLGWKAALSRGADILLSDRAAEMQRWGCGTNAK